MSPLSTPHYWRLLQSFATSPVAQMPVLPKVMLNIKLLCFRLWYAVANDRTFDPPLESDPLLHVLGYLGSLRMLLLCPSTMGLKSFYVFRMVMVWIKATISASRNWFSYNSPYLRLLGRPRPIRTDCDLVFHLAGLFYSLHTDWLTCDFLSVSLWMLHQSLITLSTRQENISVTSPQQYDYIVSATELPAVNWWQYMLS